MPGTQVAKRPVVPMADTADRRNGRIHQMDARTLLFLAFSSNPGAGYDIVLLAHVLSAVVGFGAVGVAGASAMLLGRRMPPSDAVVRYYRPGINAAGRTLFLVPVLGCALIGMGQGAWSYSDGWVIAGLILWTMAAVAAELWLWPAERGLQRLLACEDTTSVDLGPLRRRVSVIAGGSLLIFGAAMVVMVAKP
jgi:hypothetical protein